MNRIEMIVEKLLKHELSKYDAISALEKLLDEQRKIGAIEFEVSKVSFSVQDNHGIIEAMIPYGYSKIEKRIKKGSKIDVCLIH